MKVKIKVEKEVDARFIAVAAQVRYWKDATVNGVEDEKGDLIPCREDTCWVPLIDIDSGIIVNWELGKEAEIHYKICDAGIYTVLDENREDIIVKDGYVPEILSPGESGYGDYIIMKVNATGAIENWKIKLDDIFEQDDD